MASPSSAPTGLLGLRHPPRRTSLSPTTARIAMSKYKDLDDDLIEAVQCPSCQNVALPPIVSCTTGHIICSRCLPKTKRCLVCSNSFTTVQNVPAQKLVGLLSIQCFYPACGLMYKGDVLKDHLLECPYRPIRCNETELLECKDKKIDFEDYIQHLSTVHGCTGIVSEQTSYKFTSRNNIYSTDRIWPVIPFVHDGKHFLVQKRMKSGLVYCWISYFGPDPQAMRYSARITIESGKAVSGPRVEWTVPVHSIRARLETLEKLGHVVCIPSSILHTFGRKASRQTSETNLNEYTWTLAVGIEKSGQ